MPWHVAEFHQSALLHELIAHGVVSAAELASGGVELEEASRSHSAYRVSVGGVPRAFVKRCDPIRSQGRNLHCEAVLYRIAGAEGALNGVVPRCQVVSPDDTLIVIDPLPVPPEGSRWPYSGPVLEGRAGHPILEAYGRAVARTHSVVPPPFGEAPWLLLALEFGWGNDPHLPQPVRRLFRSLSARPVFRRGFWEAWNAWRATGLMHGDLRWTNVLFADGEVPHVWLVDWELSCLGDPAWDVGSVLADIVSSASLASGQLATMRQFAEAVVPFLSAYREEAQPPVSTWRALLTRSSLNAGVRLVQAVSEHGHVSGSDMNAVAPLLIPWSVELLRNAVPIAAELDRAVAE